MTSTATAEAPPEVVARAMAGDMAAFGVIYKEYYGIVYRFTRYRVQDTTLAEDIAADVFLRALRRVGTFEWQGTDIGAWLLTITRNIITDHYRSGRHRKEIIGGDEVLQTRASNDFEAFPDEIVTSYLANAEILALLPELSAEQAQVIRYRFLEDLSILETAQKMGKAETAVKTMQHRAIRSLARLIPEGWQR